MKRTLVVALAVLVAVSVLGYAYFRGREYRIVITQEQIDAELAKRFPSVDTFLIVFQFRTSDPEVTLLPDSNRVRLGFRTQLNLKIPNRRDPIEGTFGLVGGIRYKPETAQFLLVEPKIEAFEVSWIPPEMVEKARAAVAANAAAKGRVPVYTFRGFGLKAILARLLLKDVRVERQEIHVIVGL